MSGPDHDVSGLDLPGIDPSRKERWVRYVLGEVPYLMYLHGLTPMEALTVTVCSTPEGDSVGSAALLINRISGKRLSPRTVYTHLGTARAKGVMPWDYPPLKGEGNENASTVNSENRAPQYVPPKAEVFDRLSEAVGSMAGELVERGADFVEWHCFAVRICYPALVKEPDFQLYAMLDAWMTADLAACEDGDRPDRGDAPMDRKGFAFAAARALAKAGGASREDYWRSLIEGEPPSLDELNITL